MLMESEKENVFDKMSCLQNDIKFNINELSELTTFCGKNGTDNCYKNRCCCRRIKRNLFYIVWCAFPLMLTAYFIVISYFVYLNGTMKNELDDMYNKLKVVQEHQDYMYKLLSEYRNAENQLGLVLENNNNDNNTTENKIISSFGKRFLYKNEYSSGGNEGEFVFPRKQMSESVHRLNKIENFEDSSNTEKEVEVTESLLENSKNDDPGIEPSMSLCDLLHLLDDEYSTQCELGKLGSRTKRSNMRGKQNRRNPSTGRRAQPNKKPNIQGPVASHFKGGVPETFIQDGGSLVAPWYHDSKSSSDFGLKYEFRDGRGTVEVAEEGLYMIYAQVYYLTTEVFNSFSINIREKEAEGKPVALCSANAVVPKGGVTEVSCYTAVVKYLNATNQVYLTQQDRNRRMILRDGYSFLGIIRLNTASTKKRHTNRN